MLQFSAMSSDKWDFRSQTHSLVYVQKTNKRPNFPNSSVKDASLGNDQGIIIIMYVL